MRYRDLPGGTDRATYEWPRITAVHPEHGSYEMDVHCLRTTATGALVLYAFGGELIGVSRAARSKQVEMIAEVARGTGAVVEPIVKADITQAIAVRLAATFHTKPGSVVVMQVARPDGAGE